MTGSSISRWLGPAAGAAFLALLLSGAARAEGPADTQEALASHFRTAPEAVPPQMQLVQIFVNGVDSGLPKIIVSSGPVSLPASTVAALRIAGLPGDTLVLSGRADITSRFDEAKSVLDLTVPIAMLGPNRLNLGPANRELSLSPETWGTYANYDVNLRRGFGAAQNSTGTIGAGAGLRWGGLFDINGLGPDLAAHNSLAYDSARQPGQPLVRLATNPPWRPALPHLPTLPAAPTSTLPISLPAARSYRIGGFQVRPDPNASPSWTSLPVPSING